MITSSRRSLGNASAVALKRSLCQHELATSAVCAACVPCCCWMTFTSVYHTIVLGFQERACQWQVHSNSDTKTELVRNNVDCMQAVLLCIITRDGAESGVGSLRRHAETVVVQLQGCCTGPHASVDSVFVNLTVSPSCSTPVCPVLRPPIPAGFWCSKSSLTNCQQA